jgi:hypothetical protein
MAPRQPLTIIDPLAWERSTVTRLALGQLVTAGQLAANEDGRPAKWIVPPGRDHAPNPPSGYVVSFICFHERGFMAPASRFMRALCFHYGVELHNFVHNSISQAATFVGVCEGFLGIPVNWDLWVHLFRGELFTLSTSEQRTRHAGRVGGLSLALWVQRKDDYIPLQGPRARRRWLEVRRRPRRPRQRRRPGPRGRGSVPSPLRGEGLVLSRGCVSDRRGPDGLLMLAKGGANRASPRTGQGVEGGRVHPHPAVFVKGAAGVGGRSGNSG